MVRLVPLSVAIVAVAKRSPGLSSAFLYGKYPVLGYSATRSIYKL